MSQPTPYVRQANFTDHTQNYPDVPQDGTEMDAEFNALKVTLDETLTNLSLIQRDDGGLRPKIVDRASLADTLVLGVETPAIGWFTGTAYEIGQEVWVSSKLYVCNVAHTSGVFATDLAAARWTEVLDASPAMIGVITADAQAAQAGAEAAEMAAVAAAAGISDLVASAANYWATVGGTDNALVLTTTPLMDAYEVGHKIRFVVGTTSTGAVMMNTSNSLGSRTIRKTTGVPTPLVDLAPGDLPAGTIAEIEYISDAAGYQLLNVRPHAQATDVASVGTINLNTTTGDYVAITGTTTITAFTLAQGQTRTCRSVSAFVLTHSSNLILPTGANITTAAGDVFVLRGEASGVVRVTGYMRASGQGLTVDPLVAAQADRRLRGLVLSNNTTDAVNDIDISAGSCVSDDGTTIMTLAANITIETDAVFDGTGNKGLDTGAAGDNTYHVWVVNNPSTGATRAIASLSVSAPTLLSGWTKKKCIGSIVRSGGTILAFKQTGNIFNYDVPRQFITGSTNSSTSAANVSALCPTGLKLQILATGSFDGSVIGGAFFYDPDQTGAAPSAGTGRISVGSGVSGGGGAFTCVTNASGEVRWVSSHASRTTNHSIMGWVDPRV